MKRALCRKASALLAALLLAGCAAAPANPVQTEETAEATPAPAAEEAEKTAAAPTLRELTNAADGRCYLQSRIDDTAQIYLTTLDLTGGQQRVLCAKPGCTHSGPDCWAWLRADNSAQARQLRILTDGARLYWIWETTGEGTTGTQPYSAVFTSGTEGAPAPLWEWMNGTPDYCGVYQQDYACTDSHWFTDGENLWVFQRCEPKDETGQPCFPASLCRLVPNEDPEGPPYRAECVWRQDIGAYGQYLGLVEGKILFSRSLRADGTPARRDGDYENTCRELRLLSADGSCSQALQTDTYGATRAAALLDGLWYTVPAGSDQLQVTDLGTGQTRTVCTLPLEGDGEGIDLGPVYEGRLAVAITRENREDGYVVQLDDGTLTARMATWAKNGVTPRLPRLYARAGDRCLLMVGTRDRMLTAMGPDGSTDTFDSPVFLWAVTDLDSWLDGDQNWQLCTILNPDGDL